MAVISRHSVLTAALPRQWNLVIMRLNFVLAKTGSIIGCRLPYGAEIGTLYAERYPKRIRAMALDGIPDHALWSTTIFTDNARAYEDTLTRFAAWCAQDPSCALHGRDVLALYDQLVQRADQQPLPAPACASEPCRPTVTGSDIQPGAYELLLFKEPLPAIGLPGWSGLAQALAHAEAGDASSFAARLATGPRDDPFPGLAVNCLDFPRVIDRYSDLGAFEPARARHRAA